MVMPRYLEACDYDKVTYLGTDSGTCLPWFRG